MSRSSDIYARARRRRSTALLLELAIWSLALVFVAPASAEDLRRVIPNLFGGSLGTTFLQTGAARANQEPDLARRFRGLPAVLAAARSQAPIPSATGAFRFAWDSELDTFVRSKQSLGPTLAERATTLGKGVLTIGLSYTHSSFDTLEGDDLGNLRTRQPAFSPEFLATLPSGDQVIFADDILETHLAMRFKLDLLYLSAAYGVTDDIDLSLAIAVNRIRMRGRATAMILDPEENGVAFFGSDQEGVISNGRGPICGQAFRCAEDSFDESASGTGDIYLRGKWAFANTRWADFAAAAVLTVPTGNGDDLLGFRDPTLTPWLIASRTFGRISPHLNLGYSIRSGRDVSQAQWIVGADARATDWLTLGVDFLGYHDDRRDGNNDDVVQSALGIKLNPFGQLVTAASLQLPLNRQGLRADLVYTFQVEYTF